MYSVGENFSNVKILSLYLVSGLLLGIGFVFPEVWLVVIFGIAIFFQAVTLSKKNYLLLIGGIVAWTTKMLFAIGWFWKVYPITQFDLVPSKWELVAIGGFWLFCAFVIGLSGGIFSLISAFILRNFSKRFFVLVVPFFWLIMEVTGSYLFSFFTYGVGGTINGVFSFGYVGYLVAEHPLLLQLANLGGVYILTLTAVLVGASFWQYLYVNGLVKKTKIILGLGFLFWVSTFLFSQSKDFEGKTKVAIIDTDFGGSEYLHRPDREIYHEEQIREALRSALEMDVDYVVMSEYSRYLNARMSPEASYLTFRFHQADTRAVVVDAGRTPLLGTDVTLRATIYDGLAKTAYGVDKQYLVPQGEYMPLVSKFGIGLFGSKITAEKIEAGLNYRRGPLVSQKDLPSNVPGILFCFASADPLGVWKLRSERELPFVAHPISHAWFNNPTSLWLQLDTMLKVQAVWNDVPIISAGNKVAGAIYTTDGRKLVPAVQTSGEGWQVKLVSF